MKKCFLWFHKFTSWKIENEVPIWKDPFDKQSIGSKPESDWHVRIIGKMIEQKRYCLNCGLTQIKIDRWTT